MRLIMGYLVVKWDVVRAVEVHVLFFYLQERFSINATFLYSDLLSHVLFLLLHNTKRTNEQTHSHQN